jgi:hypothetical protein
MLVPLRIQESKDDTPTETGNSSKKKKYSEYVFVTKTGLTIVRYIYKIQNESNIESLKLNNKLRRQSMS